MNKLWRVTMGPGTMVALYTTNAAAEAKAAQVTALTGHTCTVRSVDLQELVELEGLCALINDLTTRVNPVWKTDRVLDRKTGKRTWVSAQYSEGVIGEGGDS